MTIIRYDMRRTAKHTHTLSAALLVLWSLSFGTSGAQAQNGKTIQHRVHQLVERAKELKASNPNAIPDGFVDGSKEWERVNGHDYQYTSVYEFTQYVEPGQSTTLYFPMIQYGEEIMHRDYQRFYNYQTDGLLPNGVLNLGVNNQVTYQNGVVTGIRIHNNNVQEGRGNYVQNSFTATLPRGTTSLDIACDLSNYTDMEWDAQGDISKEPSISQRVIWHLRSAAEFADRLANIREGEFLEKKTIHFPARSVYFEPDCVGLEHELSNYWYRNRNGQLTNLGSNQVQVDIELQDNETGIQLLTQRNYTNQSGIRKHIQNEPGLVYNNHRSGGQDNFNFKGDSRFIAFIYPNTGRVKASGPDHPAYIRVYANGNRRYPIAEFELIFDEGTSTLPWSDVLTENSERSPIGLQKLTSNKPIASITFDYPEAYENTVEGIQNMNVPQGWANNAVLRRRTFKSSQLALDFSYANYIHSTKWKDEDNGWKDPNGRNETGVMPATHNLPLSDNRSYYYDCKWGEYVLTSETGFWNALGPFLGVNNNRLRQNKAIDKYLFKPATGMVPGFLYVDASERAGRVVTVPFEGEFCAGNELLCSGWITTGTAFGWNDGAAPSSVILSLIGRDYNADGTIKKEKVFYRFCPGQISLNMRHENGEPEVVSNVNLNAANGWISTNTDWKEANESGPWQQFFFKFSIDETFDRYFLDVDNNCVSTTGGDFMLDDIQVFASVPTVEVDRSTPLCVHTDENGDAVYDATMLKVEVPFKNELEILGKNEATSEANAELIYKSFAIIKKDVFLTKFQEGLQRLGEELTKSEIEAGLKEGRFEDEQRYNEIYKEAFRAAQIGSEENKTQYWSSRRNSGNPENVGIYEFAWSTFYENDNIQPEYVFSEVVNDPKPVYRRTANVDDTEIQMIVFNGNVSGVEWEAYTEYYVISYETAIGDDVEDFSKLFNIRSACNKMYTFSLRPPLELKGIEIPGDDYEAVACENQIPTLLAKMEAYTDDEEKKVLDKINFDWFYGKLPKYDDEGQLTEPGVKADLATFNATLDGYDFSIRQALMNFRVNYPTASTFNGVTPKTTTDSSGTTFDFTADMLAVLRQLEREGQLELYTRVVNVQAQRWSEDDPYTYIIAIPVHDEYYNQAIYGTDEVPTDVVYYCDEPQALRIGIQNKAPQLSAGFENGLGGLDYNYPEDTGILSIRLARMSQFQMVRHGADHDRSGNGSKLWIPVRGAVGSSEEVVGVKHGIQLNNNDPYIYLTKTDDPYFTDKIANGIDSEEGRYPVGTVFSLAALDESKEVNAGQHASDKNHLGVYFWKSFDVHDGYTYTLKVPFIDAVGSLDGTETTGACEGHMLLKLKIVPDYEVWMGTEENHDWNCDDNWRRADNDDLLLQEDGYAPNTEQEYLTNEANGNHNGFAPLYCTHLLIMTPDGDLKFDDNTPKRGDYSPELYDMYDDKETLTYSPFPNLRSTATDILKYDFQASPYDDKDALHKAYASHGAGKNDFVAEMYEINKCKDIVFQHHTELLNSHLLSYDKAWVEYSLAKNQWHLVGSPLQDMISGEWYAPQTSARQETTYFEPIQFRDEINGGGWKGTTTDNHYNITYDRFSPAVYQRTWDKAKAVLYEKGANWLTTDGEQVDAGSAGTGHWSDDRTEWILDNSSSADDYLERISYKPMGKGKANVAIKGTWSGTYNDAAVRYSEGGFEGGFSLMPINTHKNKDRDANEHTLFRLPKEDAWYDTYDYGTPDGKRDRNSGSRVYIEDNFDLQRDIYMPANGAFVAEKSADNTIELNNRGRLRTDYFAVLGEEGVEKGKILEKLITGEKAEYTMTLKNQGNGSTGMFLACNPFICGLDMEEFFRVNTNVAPFYLVLEDGETMGNADAAAAYDSHYKDAYGEWTWNEVKFRGAHIDDGGFQGEEIVAPKYAFFIRTLGEDLNELTVKFTRDMMVRTYGTTTTEPDTPAKPYLTIRATRNGRSSEAHVMVHPDASNQFLPDEDMETLIDDEIAADVPVVFTLTGRLATSINRLHDFTCLPLGIESNSVETCVLTFTGVDKLSPRTSHLSPLLLYDAYLQSLTPVEEGMVVRAPGQSLNRYFLVCGTPSVGVAESNIQIYGESGQVHVVSTTTTPLTTVRAYDTTGRLVYADAPEKSDYLFSLPKGVFIIEATTEKDRKVQKHSIY